MEMKLIISLFLVALVSKTCEGRPSSNVPCNQAADILFLVDTSSSIWPGFFDKNVKTFLKDVISSFNIGPGPLESRVGILLFSTREYLEFHLNKYQSTKSLLKAVDAIRFRGGDTYTHRALEYASKVMLTPEHGSRDGVAKLVVVLTDGKSANAKQTAIESATLRAKGADIFAIGVGNGVDFQELHTMASSPSHQFVFQVTDFKALDSIKRAFSQTTCGVLTSTSAPATTATTTAATTTLTTQRLIRTTKTSEKPPHDEPSPAESCEGKAADLYFLLDASSSVYIEHFHNRVLPFVRDLVSSFQISPQYTRVGIVTFSNNVNHEFSLSSHDNIKSLLAAIQPEHIDYLTGATNTGEAIEYVSNHGFGPGEARKGVPQVMITVTDGLSQMPKKTALAAESARKKGISMFAVGVGKEIDEQELSDISSNPDEDYVFHVDDFKALSTITKLLAQKACKAVSDENKPSNLAQCSKMSSNVMFVYEYMESVPSSKVIVEELISQFANDVAKAAPRVKVGMLSQPCIGGTIPLGSIDKFQAALTSIRRNYYVTYAQLVSQLRTEVFGAVPLSEQRVAVLVMDEATRNFDQLLKEVLRLKFNNVKVIIVAVGKVAETVLEQLASEPIKEHVLRVDSYSNMRDTKLDILDVLCTKYSKDIFGFTEPDNRLETTVSSVTDTTELSEEPTENNEPESTPSVEFDVEPK